MNRTTDPRLNRHAPYRAPQRALSSTGHSDPARVHSDPAADPDANPLKTRLRNAYSRWSNTVNGGRELFAGELGVTLSAIKHGLSPSDHRPLDPATVLAAEHLAADHTSAVTDAELGAAVRHILHLVALAAREHAA